MQEGGKHHISSLEGMYKEGCKATQFPSFPPKKQSATRITVICVLRGS